MYKISLLVVVAIASYQVVSAGSEEEAEKARIAAFNELRSLYYKTAEDSLHCAPYFWSKTRLEKCRKEQDDLRHTLMEKIIVYWKEKHYLKPIDGKCTNGLGSFRLNVFNDPVELPCSEEAFIPPKHSAKEVREMYDSLIKLYNAYAKMCLWSKSCKEGKEDRQRALMEKIKEAEDGGYIDKKCQPSGTGFYVFHDGMQETELPCFYTAPDKPEESPIKHLDGAPVPETPTDKKVREMYDALIKLFNDYDRICLGLKRCKEGEVDRQRALMEKIKEAEDGGYIEKKCQPSGTGFYVFHDGMQETELPCFYTAPQKPNKSGESEKSK